MRPGETDTTERTFTGQYRTGRNGVPYNEGTMKVHRGDDRRSITPSKVRPGGV